MDIDIDNSINKYIKKGKFKNRGSTTKGYACPTGKHILSIE